MKLEDRRAVSMPGVHQIRQVQRQEPALAGMIAGDVTPKQLPNYPSVIVDGKK